MAQIKWLEKAMMMSEETWQRHANPWSVYSRFTLLPLFSIAFWSRDWIGWYSIIPILLVSFWAWLNPRLFGKPKSTNNWASMGTFGERVYLSEPSSALPQHHRTICRVLQFFSALGVPIFIYGLYSLQIWPLILGNVWIIVFKTWFVDRMVWLYLDKKDSNPIYQSWLK